MRRGASLGRERGNGSSAVTTASSGRLPCVHGRQPEFQLRQPGLQPVEQDRLALEALQRTGQCLLQPVGETWLPAGIEATEMQLRAHQPLKLAAIVIRAEPIEIHRLQQAVQEGPRTRPTREIMQVDLATVIGRPPASSGPDWPATSRSGRVRPCSPSSSAISVAPSGTRSSSASPVSSSAAVT